MKKIILAVAVAAVAALTVTAYASASAGGNVARYQTQTATFTTTQPYGQIGQFNNVWTHDYTVTLNPCDGSFSGTGIQYDNVGDGQSYTEKVTGTFANGKVSLNVLRNDAETWSLTNAPTDNSTVTLALDPNAIVTWPLEFKVSPVSTTDLTHYTNHGDYVTSHGGGDDAAHSCIGMPIQSR